jgi:ABC-2 type transport system permease protein
MNPPLNSQSSAVPESSINSKAIAPQVIPASRSMYWSVRRELWESRSIYIAPLAVAAVFLFGFLISTVHLPSKMRSALALEPSKQHELIQQPYNFVALLIMGTTFIVALFYCLDALHGERRDRSILFWKSLPVSDATTVLSKASIPLVVLPLLTLAITVVAHCIMLLLSSVALLESGLRVATLWNNLLLFQMWVALLYHLVAIHALWYAPIFAWLLLVSAWARRMAFLWAALPLLAIGVLEKIAFNSSHLAALLGNRLGGGAEGADFTPGSMAMDPLAHLNPGQFLISSGLWIGLIVAAAFLAGAIRLRRSQGPI